MKMLTSPKKPRIEAPITRHDLPYLMIIIAAGSITGPILLMIGLTMVPAATASLLLNGELVMTTIIAGWVFSEHIGRQTILAACFITTGGLLLSYDPEGSFLLSPGALLILGACMCWGIDNSVTRIISEKDPATIVIIKGLCAGVFGLVLGQIVGESVPQIPEVGAALIVGFFGYGISLLLFIRSVRHLGAVRTGSLFACAPFIGVAFSYLLLGEIPALYAWVCLFLMIIGVYLIITERHDHLHVHLQISHEHRHAHGDKHHLHEHHQGEDAEHTHPHIHNPLIHDHPHTPDIHHHHSHDETEDKKTIRK